MNSSNRNPLSFEQSENSKQMKKKNSTAKVEFIKEFIPINTIVRDRLFAARYKQNHSSLLLKYVFQGDYDAAKKLLDTIGNHSQSILGRCLGHEAGVRDWDSISPLEYAVWAGDISKDVKSSGMVNLLISYIDDVNYAEAYSQIANTIEHGLEGRELFAPYRDLAGKYFHYYLQFDRMNESECQEFTMDKIRKAQCNLPSVGLQMYYDPKSFHHKADFSVAPQRIVDNKYRQLRPNLALYKSKQLGAAKYPLLPKYVEEDKKMIELFCKRKKKYLQELKSDVFDKLLALEIKEKEKQLAASGLRVCKIRLVSRPS